MKIVGSNSGSKIRGPTLADADFSLAAQARDVVISSGGSSTRTTNDTIWIDHVSSTVDHEFDITLNENVVGSLDSAIIENVTPSIISFDSTSNKATRIADGIAQINVHTEWVSKGVKFNVHRDLSTTAVEFSGFASGSLAKHIADTIDAKLTGTPSSRVAQYNGDPAVFGNFTRNTNRWTLGWDLSCLSPWNSYSDAGQPNISTGNMMAGTLVSPIHVIFNSHFIPVVGGAYGSRYIWFVAEDGEVIRKTAVDTILWDDPNVSDIAMLVLDSPLPSKFKPAKVLPTDFLNKLKFAAPGSNAASGGNYDARIPVITTNQDQWCQISELNFYSTSIRQPVSLTWPSSALRLQWYLRGIRTNDSSHPAFVIINGETVLLGTWRYGGPGAFTNLANQTNHDMINSAMLSSGYQLTTVDLSGFPSY
jgi:hypothetical protein